VTCWYLLCHGWIHTGTGAHACADREGDAQPEPGQLPLTEAPASDPPGEVA
jgi:hypothetical protein